EYTPQQISAFILQKIKKDAETYLGEPVSKAVITVPAYFDNDQRQATKDAGEIAGLEVVRLVNEPTAASFAYSVDKKESNLKILVFDLGGGTLDVTIMDYGDGVFEVKSTSGDTRLGGTDMDNNLMDYITSKFKEDSGVDLKNNKDVYHRLKENAEKAKIELSTTLETQINIPFIAQDKSGQPVHLNMTITRAKLEQLVSPIVDRCRKPIEQALSDANMTPADIDKILMVGGPTRMPIVQKIVEGFLNKKIERGIDPMECVAMGAAIQAGVLSGDVEDVVLVDVTPLSLGIETMGGVFTKMIERNTPVPSKQTQIFSTAADNQTTVEVHILQGERSMANDNLSLGRFKLDGVPSAPRGVPQIEITYEIDSNGILKVHAKDKATGKENSIRVEDASRLSKEDIEKMKDEAEKYGDADRVRREKIELKNRADTLIYSTRKTLKDAESKVDSGKLDEVKNLADEIEKNIREDKIDDLKEKTEELQNKLNEVGEELYKQAEQENKEKTDGQAGENRTDSTEDEGPTVDSEGRATE
ncbi:MAG: molecular chaperone DnaK, partial [Caldisericia bacterium]|nr:molecular chaperone DnaK [Caldisericia bacterium]